jgi:hypothetical protein
MKITVSVQSKLDIDAKVDDSVPSLKAVTRASQIRQMAILMGADLAAEMRVLERRLDLAIQEALRREQFGNGAVQEIEVVVEGFRLKGRIGGGG